MKAVSVALAAHLAGPVTTLATCWRITRTDGVAFRFTDHDRDLVVDGEVYAASAAYSRTAISNDAGMGVVDRRRRMTPSGVQPGPRLAAILKGCIQDLRSSKRGHASTPIGGHFGWRSTIAAGLPRQSH